MELVASLPKPEGFFDPKAPARHADSAGDAEPERCRADRQTPAADGAAEAGVATKRLGRTRLRQLRPRVPRQRIVFIGNFNGFNTYDIETPKKPKLLASVVCPGGQGDVSVHGNLLFMSVEQTRGRVDCGTQGVTDAGRAPSGSAACASSTSATSSKPKQVAAVQTCRGSHTHTLVIDPKDTANIYVYGSGTSAVRSGEELAGCSGAEPEGRSEHRALQHRRDPGAARRAARRRRSSTGRASSPTRRPARSPACGRAATTAPARRRRASTNQCHDITVFPEVGLAAGACSGNGILLDISRSGAPGAARRRSSTRTSPTGTRRRSTTTAPR